MMPPLMPSLDTSASTTALAPAGSAEGSPEGNVFSALIQGLQPVADTAAASLSSLNATALATPADPALSASPETLTNTSILSALASVLNDLGLSESSAAPELDTQEEATADTESSADATAVPPTLLPVVPLLQPAMPTLSAASLSSETVAVDAAAVTPAQSQVRQWLAAFAPAAVSNDNPGAALADTQAPQPTGLPTAPALPVSNAWVQQPLAAAFLNMSAGSDAAPGITERLGLSLEGTALSLPTDTAKGLAPTLNFAQQLGSAQNSAQTSAPVLTTLLPHAVQDPAWSEAFGQRIALLAQQGTQSATLQLNPPELGPIQVRIAMSENGAKVEFNTLQQTTSDLIETAMPRLAAALEHQGLRLDDSRVNLLTSRQDVFNAQSAFSSARQDTPQGERGQQAMPQSSRLPTDTAESESASLPGTLIRLPEPQKRGIDYYA